MRMMWGVIVVATLGFGAAGRAAEAPYRVTNLHRAGPEHPDDIVFVDELGGRTILLTSGYRRDAAGVTHVEMELWSVDLRGEERTPLAAYTLVDGLYHPERIGRVGDRLVFRLDQFAPLWTSDGTRAGTTLLAPKLDTPQYMPHLRLGDRLLLADAKNMAWSTDGTIGGTEALGVQYPRNSFGGGPPPTMGNRFFFIAANRLIATDGTAAGTSAVVDSGDAVLGGLVATPRRLFFVRETAHAQELWISDGTVNGTRRTRRFGRAFGGSRIEMPMPFEGGVVFLECSLDGALCHLSAAREDGASARLTRDRLVKGAVPILAGGRTVLFADGRGGLWRTLAMPGATTALGRCAGVCASPSTLAVLVATSTRSVFSVRGAPGESQVWVTDGTDAGTRPLDAACAHQRGCRTTLAAINGSAALLDVNGGGGVLRETARLGAPAVRPVSGPGAGPAVASGNGFLVAGAISLAEVSADGSLLSSTDEPGRRDGDANPISLVAIGTHLAFSACDGARQRVYWTQGVPDDAVLLGDGAASCGSNELPPLLTSGAALIDNGRNVARVDENGSTTTILDRAPAAMVRLGERIVLTVPEFECAPNSDDCVSGTLLTRVFVSPNGIAPATEAGTVRIAPYQPLVVDDRLLESDPATARGVFAYDPARDGTLVPIRCPAGDDVCKPGMLARLNGDLFLLAADTLWRIEGDAGTRIAPVEGGPRFHVLSNVTAVDGMLTSPRSGPTVVVPGSIAPMARRAAPQRSHSWQPGRTQPPLRRWVLPARSTSPLRRRSSVRRFG